MTIYFLGQNGESVRTTDISSFLHVAKPSTVNMVKKLIDEGLIYKEPYKEIRLTQKGISEDNELFTSCVILQDFFISKAGIDSDKAKAAGMILSAGLDKDSLDKIVCFALTGEQGLNKYQANTAASLQVRHYI